jgi:tetratricopeptide (TPR) repeat protein
MEFLRTRLEQDPENLEMASELFDIYLDLEYRDEAAELGDRLLEMQESARTYRRLGELHLQDGSIDQAIAYYERALDMPDTPDDVRRDVLFNLGIAKQQDGALAEARTYFRRALEIDRNYGQAYIAIGDLYATAVSSCGSFEEEDRAVYWLAVDYYERAKSNAPEMAAQADQKIATYRLSFPEQEHLFFNDWTAGDQYRIDYGCYSWIGETTTVKQPG